MKSLKDLRIQLYSELSDIDLKIKNKEYKTSNQLGKLARRTIEIEKELEILSTAKKLFSKYEVSKL